MLLLRSIDAPLAKVGSLQSLPLSQRSPPTTPCLSANNLQTPFAIARLDNSCDSHAAASNVIARSITSSAIYELWGAGVDYKSLHEDVRNRTQPLWEQYRQPSFRFEVDSFHGSRSTDEQRAIIESFSYMGFGGPIVMKNPDHQFIVFEEYDLNGTEPKLLYLGRLVAESGRKAINKYNLKKRSYISTTSMDAELSLVTANLAHAAPGKLIYDPFMGTGSFPLACAHFGASVFGSDLDGRSIRGKKDRNVRSNFDQYSTSGQYIGGFVADLTNTPLAQRRYLDAIVCDPPYGVREGLKVLGSTRVVLQEVVRLHDGTLAHLQENYVPPKKSYSFLRMLDDILDFSANVLVDGGRLCMWMPVAGTVEDAEQSATNVAEREAEYSIPQHPALRLVSVCTQDFNKCMFQCITQAQLRAALTAW